MPPWYEHVVYAFSTLSGADPMLRYLVDLQSVAWRPQSDSVSGEDALRAELPNLFLVQVMIRNYELRASPVAKQDFDVCSFHDHESDEERKKCPRYTALAQKKATA